MTSGSRFIDRAVRALLALGLEFRHPFLQAIRWKVWLRRYLREGDIVLFDIGAFRGDFSRSIRKAFKGRLISIGFEMNQIHAASLAGACDKVIWGALSHSNGERSVFRKNSTGDSFYKENTEHYSEVSPETIQVKTLDTVVSNHKLPLPNFVKLDVQGAELDVLRGGKRTLADTELVLLETSLINYNSEAPQVSEVVEFMQNLGFEIVELAEVHRRNCVVIQLDLLFRRSVPQDMGPKAS